MSFLRKLFGGGKSTIEITTRVTVPDKKPKKSQGPSVCPYCGVVLEPRPKRKKKCPDCGETMYVRQGQLLTDRQTQVADWAFQLDAYDVTEQDIHAELQELGQKFGTVVPVNDAVWSLYNQLIAKNASSPQDLRVIYYDMALLAKSEGRNPNQYLEESARWQLIEYAQGGFVEYVTIRTVNDEHVCKECQQIAGGQYSLKDEIENQQIPHKCTSDSGCRCGYGIYYT